MNGRSHQDGDWEHEPSEVHVTRVDLPFLELTWFFVKASLAMALAFSVTSWLWVVIGTGVITLSAGILVLIGVPGWFVPDPEPVVTMAPAPLALPPPPPPVLADEPPTEPAEAAAAEAPPPEPVDPNKAATEAMQRAEIERMRRERGQR